MMHTDSDGNVFCYSDSKVTYEFPDADSAAGFAARVQCEAKRAYRAVDGYAGTDLAELDAMARDFGGRRETVLVDLTKLGVQTSRKLRCV